MAQKTFQVRNGTVVVETAKRPVVKGAVCYDGKMFELKQDEGGDFISLYDDDDYPMEPVADPELERLLGWFCKNHEEIAEAHGAESVHVSDEQGVYFVKRPPRMSTALMAALTLAASIVPPLPRR
jgi:hypothetical protein